MAIVIDSLDASAFYSVAEALEDAAKGLGKAVSNGCLETAQVAAEAARANCPSESGELAQSISAQRTDGGAEAVCTAPYAKYVEFGTGVVGVESGQANSTTLNAQANAGYIWNDTRHGDAGWTYYDQKKGKFFHTRGQRGKAFMGHGADEARSQFGAIMMKHIHEAGL